MSVGRSKFGGAVKLSTPVAGSIVNCEASAPPLIEYVNTVAASGSEAVTVVTAVLFSTT